MLFATDIDATDEATCGNLTFDCMITKANGRSSEIHLRTYT